MNGKSQMGLQCGGRLREDFKVLPIFNRKAYLNALKRQPGVLFGRAISGAGSSPDQGEGIVWDSRI